MKYVSSIFIFILSALAVAQEDGRRTVGEVRYSSVESHIAPAEVLQYSFPEITIRTPDGTRKVTVELQSGIGTYNIDSRQWVAGRLEEYRQKGAHITYVVTGTDLQSPNYNWLVDHVSELKQANETLVVGSEAITIPQEFNYQKERVKWTLIRMVIAGGATMVGAYFGSNMPMGYMALMATQASLMSGVWIYNSAPYNNWVNRSGFFPGATASESGKLQRFVKQWSASSLYLYLMKQGSALMPVYEGVTNPVAILSDAMFIGFQGALSRFFYNLAISHHVQKTVEANPELKNKMEIWRMRTSTILALGFGIVEQLANFHVPGAGMALIGLGIGGAIVYKYVAQISIKDTLRGIIARRGAMMVRGTVAVCSLLFAL